MGSEYPAKSSETGSVFPPERGTREPITREGVGKTRLDLGDGGNGYAHRRRPRQFLLYPNCLVCNTFFHQTSRSKMTRSSVVDL